jgi:large subunit ribosomal protein L6
MSRVAKNPVPVLSGAEIQLTDGALSIKGPKGKMDFAIHPDVTVAQEERVLKVSPRVETKRAWAMAGTVRALLNNMMIGVTDGFERRLTLIGVGYRAQAKGKVLNLSLGFSHPVDFPVPEGIEITTPSPTEILITGYDKQKVGQVAANIRAYRPPEPYKGKGIRYSDELVVRKEAKKK